MSNDDDFKKVNELLESKRKQIVYEDVVRISRQAATLEVSLQEYVKALISKGYDITAIILAFTWMLEILRTFSFISLAKYCDSVSEGEKSTEEILLDGIEKWKSGGIDG